MQWNDSLVEYQKVFIKIIAKFEKSLGLQTDIKWKNVMILICYHILGYIWCHFYAFPAKWQTILFAIVMYVVVGSSGILCGVHRLWTHRSYKAKLPLRIYLMLAFTSVGQNSIYDWVRDHRVHHKFSDTAADPHDVTRGFWYAHIGWLLMKKSSLVIEKGRQIDMSDIESDPVAMFERKHSFRLSLITCYILPTLFGMLLWGETWQCAVAWQCIIRVYVQFHAEMSVNSFAHLYGYKPYSLKIKPCQNAFVTLFSGGEGWHNYHHMFPWDYKAAEDFDFLNFGTLFIKIFAMLGQAYDLKEPSPALIHAAVSRQKVVEDEI